MQMGNTPSASEAPQPVLSSVDDNHSGSTQSMSVIPDASAVSASVPLPKAKKKPRTPKVKALTTDTSNVAVTQSPGTTTNGNSSHAQKKQRKPKVQSNGAIDRTASPQTPINRFKAQQPGNVASPYSFSTPSESHHSPWQASPSLVYFSGPSSAQFERVLNASFPKSINSLQSMIRSKMRVDSAAPIQMSFVNTEANVCPLDDEQDLEALVANAAQAKRIKVQITTSEQRSEDSMPPPATSLAGSSQLLPSEVTRNDVSSFSLNVASPASVKPKKATKAPRPSKAAIPTASAENAAQPTSALAASTAPSAVSSVANESDMSAVKPLSSQKAPLRWEDRPTPASLLASLWPSDKETAQISAQPQTNAPVSDPVPKSDATAKKTKKEPAKRKRQSDIPANTQQNAVTDSSIQSESSPTAPMALRLNAGQNSEGTQTQPDHAALTSSIATSPAATPVQADGAPPAKKPRRKVAEKLLEETATEPTQTDSVHIAAAAGPALPASTTATSEASNRPETSLVSVPDPAVPGTSEVSALPELVSSTPAKRKPGRPRKNATVEDSSAVVPSQESIANNAVPSPKVSDQGLTSPQNSLSNEVPASSAPLPASSPIAEVPSTSQDAPKSSQPVKAKARSTRAKVDRCIVCKQSPSHAKEECGVFKEGKQAVDDLLQKYKQEKSRKKEDKEAVETLRQWSDHLAEDDVPLSQLGTSTNAALSSQADPEPEVTTAKKSKTPLKKSGGATENTNSVMPASEALELPPPSGVEAKASATEKATASFAKKAPGTAKEPKIAVVPSSPMSPDASQSGLSNASPKRARGLRAPSESSEAELATSPLLSAMPRADEDMDVDPLNETPTSTPDTQMEERRRKHNQTDAKETSKASTAVNKGKGTRSASITSSDTSDDSESSDSETQSESEDEDESEKTLNADTSVLATSVDAEPVLERKTSPSGASASSSSSSSSASSSSDSDSSSSSEDEGKLATNAGKRGNGPSGTSTAAVSNPFLKGLTPQGNAKSSAAFSPKSTPFTRLSELKPSTLRQNMSQPSSPMSGGGLNGLGAGAQSQSSFFASKPSTSKSHVESSDSDSDSDSSSSSSSSSEEEVSTSKSKKQGKGESGDKARVIPASKRAGASVSPKKRKSVFSLFS